jgi:hypothetical protein
VANWRRVARQKGGNPAKANQDPAITKLEKTTHLSVELVRDLRFHLPEDVYLHLRAGSLGLLWVMAALTGKPSPAEVVDAEMKSIEQIKADVWEECAVAYRKLHPGPWPTNPYKRRKK